MRLDLEAGNCELIAETEDEQLFLLELYRTLHENYHDPHLTLVGISHEHDAHSMTFMRSKGTRHQTDSEDQYPLPTD